MKVRTSVSVEIGPGDLKAFDRYHRLKDPTDAIRREMIKGILETVGTGGLGEQIAQGHEWLEGDALRESEEGEA